LPDGLNTLVSFHVVKLHVRLGLLLIHQHLLAHKLLVGLNDSLALVTL
jgi:hypothetical protein